MNELATEEMQSSKEPTRQEASGCPLQTMHTQRTVLDADDELVFPNHKRVVTQYSSDASQAAELHLYYGEKEIPFDEPGLFAFGEGLTKHSRFVAGTATTWGEAYDWPQVREPLERLIEEGILRRADANASAPLSNHNGARLSPLPPAHSTLPRAWFECEAITRELTGDPLESGYLNPFILVGLRPPVQRIRPTRGLANQRAMRADVLGDCLRQTETVPLKRPHRPVVPAPMGHVPNGGAVPSPGWQQRQGKKSHNECELVHRICPLHVENLVREQ